MLERCRHRPPQVKGWLVLDLQVLLIILAEGCDRRLGWWILIGMLLQGVYQRGLHVLLAWRGTHVVLGCLKQELLSLCRGLHVCWCRKLGTFVLLLVLLLCIATASQVEIILKPPLRTDQLGRGHGWRKRALLVILFLCGECDLINFEYLKHAPLYLRELSVSLAEAGQSDQLLRPLIEDFDHFSGGHDHPTG